MQEVEILLAEAQAGDGNAYGRLVARFQDMAVAYARSILRDPQLAEDASQEAFVEALIFLNRVHDASSFPAWLRRIVFKHCDRIRRARKVELGIDGEYAPLEPAPDPLSAVEIGESRRRIYEALDSLPDDVREAAHLFYLGSQSHKEIAGFLDLTPTVVNNRLYQARKRLRKELMTMAIEELESQRPSKDERFVENVVRQSITREEMRGLERLHEPLLEPLSKTLTQACGRPVNVGIAWVDQTYYKLVASANSSPAATYRCSLGEQGQGVLVCFAATTVAECSGATAEEIEAAERQPPKSEQIAAFHQTATHVLKDLQILWRSRDVALRGLDVQTRGPALTWSLDSGLKPTGFAPPEEVVVIVGFEVSIRAEFASIVLCYNYDVAKANAL